MAGCMTSRFPAVPLWAPGLRAVSAAALVAGCLGLLSPLRSAHVINTDPAAQVDIELIEYFENSPTTGWIPVAVRINNRAAVARSWEVTFDIDLGYDHVLLGTWDLPVPGGVTRVFDLFVPQPWFVTPANYFRIRSLIGGPGIRGGVGMVNRMFTGGNPTPFAGMSQTLAAENWSRLEAELAPPAPGGMAPHRNFSGTRFDAAQVPADWRAWSGFASLWLHRDDWVVLNAAQRLALRRWIAQGGCLYVAGAGPGLEDLLAGAATYGDPGARYGLGWIRTAPLQSKAIGEVVGPRLHVARVADAIRDIRHDSPALAQLTNESAPTEAEQRLGEIRPGGPVLAILVAGIALLLGPVNIFLLAPARRRARLFITVPLISAGGALALVLLILLQDGTGGDGRRAALVALLPDRPEALVLQEQFVRTGLLVKRSFSLPEDVALIDYTNGPPPSRYMYHSPSYRPPRGGLNRAGTRISGEWFTSRTVHAHHLRTFIPTRAALTVDWHGASPQVISTCPGVLRDVVVIDERGRAWHVPELPPGQSRQLASSPSANRDRWSTQLFAFGASLAAAAAQEERPLTFRARADSWDESVPIPTLPSIDWRDDAIFVTGPVRQAPGRAALQRDHENAAITALAATSLSPGSASPDGSRSSDRRSTF